VPIVAALALPPTLPWRRRVVHIAVPVVVAALLIAPWTLRNATQLHAFVPVSTETGNTLAGVYNHASLRHGARWLLPAHTGAYRAIYRRYGAGAKADGALTGAVVRWVARHPAYPARVLVDNSARLLGLTGPAWAAFSLRTMSLGKAGAALVWAGVLAVTLLALAGARAARGRGAPRTVWLMLAALFVPVALVNGELRLGAPARGCGSTRGSPSGSPSTRSPTSPRSCAATARRPSTTRCCIGGSACSAPRRRAPTRCRCSSPCSPSPRARGRRGAHSGRAPAC